jgi:hypothetical protein
MPGTAIIHTVASTTIQRRWGALLIRETWRENPNVAALFMQLVLAMFPGYLRVYTSFDSHERAGRTGELIVLGLEQILPNDRKLEFFGCMPRQMSVCRCVSVHQLSGKRADVTIGWVKLKSLWEIEPGLNRNLVVGTESFVIGNGTGIRVTRHVF